MQNPVLDDLEKDNLSREDSGSQTLESDNAWQLKSVSKEEFSKWQLEKDRYDEMIEYIREVDEILNLIKPFPRDEGDGVVESQRQDLVRSDTQSRPRFKLDHLENIIKLVQQLKELQENSSKLSERSCCLKDLKNLREHKVRLKTEELELRRRTRSRSAASLEDFQEEFTKSRKISSTASEKLENPTECWQHKRKSLCLPNVQGQNKSKVSKWTKVKEAFHWERTSVVLKPNKKELYSLQLPKEKNLESSNGGGDHSPDGSSSSALDGFSPPLLPPPPPPPLIPKSIHSSSPVRSEDLLLVRSVQDFPSSSSSDRLDDFFTDSLAKGSKTEEGDSSSQLFIEDNEEIDDLVRKSSSGDLPQHLNKEEGTTRTTKSNKTTWGKVKDIIQTRKDSLKKKPKKRGSEEFKKRRKLSTLSTSQIPDHFDDLSSPEEKLKNFGESTQKTGYDFPEDPLTTSQINLEEKCSKKLTPALTITLPSTEELRSFSCDDLENREITDENKSSTVGHFSCQAHYCEDKSKFGKSKTGQNQRLSRWIKVKRVFLTSGSPSRPANYSPGNDSSPTSQNKSSGFFSDMESDEVSSGEWIDDKSPSQEKLKIGDSESQSTAMMLIQEDIRKSYNELQKKLSHEFDQKLREWEMKNDGSKQEDFLAKSKIDDGDSIPKFRKTRDSITVPLPNLNDLSPEFKKKLNDWKKMKTSQSSSSVSSSTTKEEIQGQNIKIKIGEWQPWRSRGSQKGKSDDLEEGQKVRSGGSRPPSSRRKDKDRGDGSTDRSDLKRGDSDKKISRSSSGGESLSVGTLTDRDGRFIRRTQKMKDIQWVQKELQKIEREKLRLEQEKEKYLEREARLEKMKRTMGTCPTQEVLVRTSAGFFRFKGISQKFTKKLYEWEKARGIAPEASTFALLEESAKTSIVGDSECEVAVPLQRSKSTGSVPELSSTLLIQTMAHHPSSLSLNDVDELKSRDAEGMDESISSEHIKRESEEPEAIIVDVEDVVEDTELLAEPLSVKCEVPFYTYATRETDRVIDCAERLYFSSPEVVTEREELIVDSRGNSDQSIFVIGNSKNIENTLTVLKTSSDQSEIGKTESQVHSLLSLEDVTSRREENFAIKGSDVVIPGITKSPKTFFDRLDSPKIRKESAKGLPFGKSDNSMSSTYKKNENKSAHISLRSRNDPEAVKRKIKEKITLMQRISMEGKPHNWRYLESSYTKPSEERSNEKTNEKTPRGDKDDGDTIFDSQQQPLNDRKTSDKSAEGEIPIPVNVFVPTTRKIISPVKTLTGVTPSVCSYIIDDVKTEEVRETPEQSEPNSAKISPSNQKSISSVQSSNAVVNDTQYPKSTSTSTVDSFYTQEKKKLDGEGALEKNRDIGIPPLPNSPKSYKKFNTKETAPSIRMIIAKYNQKISEHDSANEKRTDSESPKMWRSPVFGRRTQEKINKYISNGEVQKSASLDNMRSGPHIPSLTPPRDNDPREVKGILKSNSAGVLKIRAQNSESSTDLLDKKLPADTAKSPSALRALKIQKAKEDFFSGKPDTSSDAAASIVSMHSPRVMEPSVTLTPQLEVRIDNIDHNLIKSVSAETISGENNQSQSEINKERSPDFRPLQKSTSKFDISNIKSKFRRIRMKKEKDPKINAVAALCRQSLFIEIPNTSGNSENEASSSLSKSCPSSPVMDRNKNPKDKENIPKENKQK